ncbi:MAG: MBL fold metallo-hydrolase [Oscillospiraceae bacterium]|jgi:glyoxylase-like metal-dependent hydrolase (beta-lactamase superfamily II)|nr:MBL fold metallo-hydrolase [Oscillospiraceae bacterium]
MSEIIVLDISFQFGEATDVIHPVVLKDERSMVLVDCAYTGFLPALEQAMTEKNLRCEDLTHVFVTHQDHDHVGALAALKQAYKHVQIVASKTESPYISGQKKSLRLQQAEAMQPRLPPERQAFGLAFCNILKNVRPVNVDAEVDDGDELDWCGGCTVVATPGHTPGHVSLFVGRHETMLAGDAAVLENGRLVLANPRFTLDHEQAERSLAKLQNYGAKTILCYHGGAYDF